MFAALTPMRLHGCNGKTKKDADGNAIRVVVLTFQLQPFTDAMANDLNVKARLFNISDGLPLPDVLSTKLAIDVPVQKVSLFEAPDMDKASVVLESVDISDVITVRADKEGPVYSAMFTAMFEYPTAKDLLWLFHRVTMQTFVTMESTGQQSLIDGDEKDDDTE